MSDSTRQANAEVDAGCARTPVRRPRLAHLPTPLERLDRLTTALRAKGPAPTLWIKRDDCTGLAGGGNKARKLEYLLDDAIQCGADTVITAGALQSNHARQCAAAAARASMRCILLLRDAVAGRESAYYTNGNVLLDHLLGAELRTLPGDADMARAFSDTADEVRRSGGNPYVIPLGGSNLSGSLAYYEAARELARQAAEAGLESGHIVLATGSGGTHAGLVAGMHALGTKWRIHGISVSRNSAAAHAIVAGLAEQILSHTGDDSARPPLVSVDDGFVGEAYGVPSPAGCQALKLVARTEAILLDPVYTGKAMAGLLAYVAQGRFQPTDNVVFWHTGGSQALFAYGDSLDLG